VAAQGGAAPEVAWTKARPGRGAICTLAPFFFQRGEILLLTHELAAEVLDYAGADEPAGLFAMMLYDDGQVDKATVDVASVFLEALVQAVDQKALRVNTRMGGHLFVTEEFWFLTSPKGLDCVTEMIRTRVSGPRHDFTRQEVFQALRSGNCLAGSGGSGEGPAAWLCEVDAAGWEKPLELYGLPILSGVLPVQPKVVVHFDGTVTLKKENVNGNGAR
jgi:hypothetical protein